MTEISLNTNELTSIDGLLKNIINFPALEGLDVRNNPLTSITDLTQIKNKTPNATEIRLYLKGRHFSCTKSMYWLVKNIDRNKFDSPKASDDQRYGRFLINHLRSIDEMYCADPYYMRGKAIYQLSNDFWRNIKEGIFHLTYIAVFSVLLLLLLSIVVVIIICRKFKSTRNEESATV